MSLAGGSLRDIRGRQLSLANIEQLFQKLRSSFETTCGLAYLDFRLLALHFAYRFELDSAH
jgi:hypothetical protein